MANAFLDGANTLIAVAEIMAQGHDVSCFVFPTHRKEFKDTQGRTWRPCAQSEHLEKHSQWLDGYRAAVAKAAEIAESYCRCHEGFTSRDMMDPACSAHDIADDIRAERMATR